MLVPVIGLEIHCELATNTKIFCLCENEFGGEPNTRVCPSCMGLPGTIPLLNQTVVEYATRAGLALDCNINLCSAFDRKQYFYPDLPHAYQTSQLYTPICVGGHVDIEVAGKTKSIRINRIHMEEDAGKLMHDDLMGLSLADYNRSSVPLIEIVTEPDIDSAEEAAALLRELIRRLRYVGVSDCKMEQGSLRCDVNLSLKEKDATQLGTRAEVKNLNSIKSVIRAIEWETKRQTALLAEGKQVVQETRSFLENSGQTKSLRSKEDAQDYRYFKDEDIPNVVLTQDEVDKIKASLPVMPGDRFNQYTGEYGLSPIDARNLTEDRAISDFFEATIQLVPKPKLVANLILMELFRLLKTEEDEAKAIPFSPADFAQLIGEQEAGKITKNDAKTVLQLMFSTGQNPLEIIGQKGFAVVNDTGAVDKIIALVMAENTTAVAQYQNGETKVLGFLMGLCNRQLKGKASPDVVRERLEKSLCKAQ